MSKKLINGNGGKKQNAEWYNKEFKQQFIDGDRLDNQSEFRKYLDDTCIHKTNTNSEFVSQGLCHAGKYALTTSYYKQEELSQFSDIIFSLGSIKAQAAEFSDFIGNGINTNSRVDIHDQNGNNKTLYFEHSSHVGGIAYHEASGKFFVSNGGRVNIYNEEDVANTKHNGEIKRSDYFDIAKEVEQSSYLAVHNDDFYVGRWLKGKNGGKLAKYEIDHETGEVSDNPTIYTVPYSDIQGMEVYEKNGQEYFIFSSTDNFAKSELHVAIMRDGEFESVGALEVPAMLEQISINENGKLGMVFESDCKAYDISANQIGDIIYMDIDKAITNMEKEKEEYINKFQKIIDKDNDGKVDDIDKFNSLFNGGETATDYIRNARNWLQEKTDIALDFDKDGKNDLKEVNEWIGKKVNNITDFDKDGKSDIKEGFDSLSKKVNNALDFDRDGKNDIKEAADTAKEVIKDGIDYAWEKGKDIADDIGDGIDKLKDWGKDKLDDIGDFFGF